MVLITQISSFWLFYSILSILLTFGYAILIIQYLSIWKKLPIWKIPPNYQPRTFLSIIIPARNEALSILDCLKSILDQGYPGHLFEIIVVDDFSEDNTPLLIKKLQHPNIKLLELKNFITEKETIAFKKKALEIAISKSKGELFITTDADCVAPPHWLSLISSFYEKNNFQLIAAPVNFHQEKSVLEKFQSLDFMGMMCITGAGIHSNLQKMCNGANLAYTKKAFMQVDGFNGINHMASGDDMLLMHKIVQAFPKQVGFLKNQEATILTEAKSTWTAFFQQRLRWATKNASYTDWKVTAILAMVFFFCCTIVLSFFLIPFFGLSALFLFLFQFSIKTIFDYLFLSKMAVFFKRKELMKSFFIAQIFHLLYIVSIGVIANLKKEYVWKGRVVR